MSYICGVYFMTYSLIVGYLRRYVMNASLFFRIFIPTLLVNIMISGGKQRRVRGVHGWKQRKLRIWAWRIGFVYSIMDILLMFFSSEPLINRMFTFVLFITCIFFMPLFSQLNTCDCCGHCMYWHTLYSNKCPHCGEKIS